MLDSLMAWFIEPFSFAFMQRALIIALAVGIVCAALSCYLVLKGWSLMGDAISHAVLPGIVVAYLLAVPLGIGAFFAGIICAVSVGFLEQNSRLKQDTVMGIVFSGMFAFGLVLFAKIETNQHLLHILFGNVLGIKEEDFRQSLLISLLVALIILLKRRDFLLYCFDPIHAGVAGLNTTWLHYGLLVLLSLVIISAMQVVGVILVVAMLITPGITGFVLVKRFDKMMLIAILSAMLSAFFGVLFSFHWNVATGATIVLLQAGGFLAALAIRTIRSIK